MRKAHTDKIRATFYIDKRLYQLLKRCSAIEGIPMSSIINDDLLEKRVGKYAYPSPKDWEDHMYYEAGEEEQKREIEAEIEFYSNSPEGILDSRKSYIKKQLKDSKISKEQAETLIQEAEKKFERDIEKEKKIQEREQKELEARWHKAIKEFPLD